MSQTEVTGENLRVYGWACRGVLSRESLEMRVRQFVELLGLTPVGSTITWGYPLDGKGGVGETVYLPFSEGAVILSWWKKALLKLALRYTRWAFLFFQPFTESFMAVDTYPQIKKIVVVLVTCAETQRHPATLVARLFGPIKGYGYFQL